MNIPAGNNDAGTGAGGMPVGAEKVTLTAEDNTLIVANYFRNPDAKRAVVLVHKLGSDKSEYNTFAVQLLQDGYAAIAIDMRGHGESTFRRNETLNWETFASFEFNKIPSDIAAAVDFLEDQGFSRENISIVGASIGANATLKYAAAHSRIRSVVLLSPGLDYRGVETEPIARQFMNPALIVASSEDTYAFQSSKSLDRLIPQSTLIELQNAGHGVEMMSYDPTLSSRIRSWLQEN